MRFVVEAVVAYTLVEVLFVVVELTPVKFCSVDDPLTSRLAVVNNPLELILPKVPVVAKKLVVVALVPVAFVNVKFWRVVEPRATRLVVVAVVVIVRPDGKT